jgi:hypothetical protein
MEETECITFEITKEVIEGFYAYYDPIYKRNVGNGIESVNVLRMYIGGYLRKHLGINFHYVVYFKDEWHTVQEILLMRRDAILDRLSEGMKYDWSYVYLMKINTNLYINVPKQIYDIKTKETPIKDKTLLETETEIVKSHTLDDIYNEIKMLSTLIRTKNTYYLKIKS